jgi:hypothetical protein
LCYDTAHFAAAAVAIAATGSVVDALGSEAGKKGENRKECVRMERRRKTSREREKLDGKTDERERQR